MSRNSRNVYAAVQTGCGSVLSEGRICPCNIANKRKDASEAVHSISYLFFWHRRLVGAEQHAEQHLGLHRQLLHVGHQLGPERLREHRRHVAHTNRDLGAGDRAVACPMDRAPVSV